MGLFDNILNKLGIKKKEAAPPVQAPKVQTDSRPVPPGMKPVSAGASEAWKRTAAVPQARPVVTPATAPKPAPMELVDVKAKLDKMAMDVNADLKWRESIVDLLKVLGMDSSLEARKALAVELGCPADKMRESANMNMWLHKTIMLKIAENGGIVPKELLD